MNIVPFSTSPPNPSLGGVRFPGEVGWLAPYGGAPSHFGGLFTVKITLVFLFFFLSDRFVPFVFMALGHRTTPLAQPKYKKNYPSPKLTLTLTSHLWQNDGLGEG